MPERSNNSDPGNYRPISLLSILNKLLQKHTGDLLVNNFKSTYPLSTQHAVGLHKREIDYQCIVDCYWSLALAAWARRWCLCCTFYYHEAFESVPHMLLIHKLWNYNIHSYILKWLVDYFSNRTQYVCVSGSVSDTLPVSSGVPQGSFLGSCCYHSHQWYYRYIVHKLMEACYTLCWWHHACSIAPLVALPITCSCKRISPNFRNGSMTIFRNTISLNISTW